MIKFTCDRCGDTQRAACLEKSDYFYLKLDDSRERQLRRVVLCECCKHLFTDWFEEANRDS